MKISDTKKAFIKTFGCQMNEHDTTKMSIVLKDLGYSFASSMEEADLILFNTCTIREKAHHKAISEIGRASSIKENKPNVVLGVCGCVAQQDGENLIKRYPQIDMVFGPDQVSSLPKLLTEVESGQKASALDLVNDPDGYRFLDQVPEKCDNTLSSFVLAMKGCNCACSYCIVPSVRGKEISRPTDEIVAEVKAVVETGAREVTLLGQNVSAYRSDTGRRGDGLASLIRRLADETGVERLRFTSPHPLFISDELIEEYSKNDKLCPHIHLPVQAGSNDVLKRMRRGYTRELYLEIASKLRAARENMSITTDLIVGFCGETEDDFELTLDLMRKVQFDSAFAFKYSPRPGTEAAGKMSDDVEKAEKERRLDKLLTLQRQTSRIRNEALIGSEGDVLAMGMDRMNKGFITGRRSDNRIVHFSGNPANIGAIVRVRITGANDNSLKGELCHGG